MTQLFNRQGIDTNYEVDQFVLQHLLGVDVSKEEADVISLDHNVRTSTAT